LESVGANCTLIRRAEARAAVQRLKAEPDEGHIDIGGPALAASLIDLVDEFRMWVNPVAVGGGKPFFPAGVHLPLELVECRPFASGVVWMRYARVRDR
jgi:dihydrofolate reductase